MNVDFQNKLKYLLKIVNSLKRDHIIEYVNEQEVFRRVSTSSHTASEIRYLIH